MADKFRYTVRGSWPFPLDMLRHDHSAAASLDDQEKINRYSAQHVEDDAVFQPVDINLVGPFKPNTARWESFSWAVPTDADYQLFVKARVEAARKSKLRDQALAKLTPEERTALDQRDD